MIDEEIANQISNSRDGSEIKGLLEKIAYKHYIIDKESNSIINWLRAESDLYKWAEFQASKSTQKFVLEKTLKDLLEKYAYSWYENRCFINKSGSLQEDWEKSIDELANQMVWQVPNYRSS
ncbi:MAG: hypothetical protein WC867_04415 [Candidatus Pacearchaeota archaeon]|jgi:hypothetical protein